MSVCDEFCGMRSCEDSLGQCGGGSQTWGIELGIRALSSEQPLILHL